MSPVTQLLLRHSLRHSLWPSQHAFLTWGFAALIANPGWAHETAAASTAQTAGARTYSEASEAITAGDAAADLYLRPLLAGQPENAGAWLDLAMLQCDRGNSAAADLLFRAIETRFLPPPEILNIIASRRLQGCRTQPPPSNHRWRLQLDRGHDSNANQGTVAASFAIGSGASQLRLDILPQYRPQADTYSQLQLGYRHHPTGTGPAAPTLSLSWQARHYDQQKQFRQSVIGAGGEWQLAEAPLPLRGGVSLQLVNLGGSDYLRQAQAHLSLGGVIPTNPNFTLGGIISLARQSYPQLTALDATLGELRAHSSYRWGDILIDGSLALLADQPYRTRPGGPRSGWHGALQVGLPGPGPSRVEAGVSQLSWGDRHVYASGLIDATRRQRLTTWRLAVVNPVSANQSVQLEYRDTLNHDRVELFAYASRVWQLGWQWHY